MCYWLVCMFMCRYDTRVKCRGLASGYQNHFLCAIVQILHISFLNGTYILPNNPSPCMVQVLRLFCLAQECAICIIPVISIAFVSCVCISCYWHVVNIITIPILTTVTSPYFIQIYIFSRRNSISGSGVGIPTSAILIFFFYFRFIIPKYLYSWSRATVYMRWDTYIPCSHTAY